MDVFHSLKNFISPEAENIENNLGVELNARMNIPSEMPFSERNYRNNFFSGTKEESLIGRKSKMQEQQLSEAKSRVSVFKINSLAKADLAAIALSKGDTVICNYEGVDTAIAQRASDFIRGAATVLGANYASVSSKITVFVPSGIHLDLVEDEENMYEENIDSDIDSLRMSNKYVSL